jgi:hypothetical protein
MPRPKSEPKKKRSSRFFDPIEDLRNDIMGRGAKTHNYGSRPASNTTGKLVIRK